MQRAFVEERKHQHLTKKMGIVLIVKILFEFIYDSFGILGVTNWDISYHVSNYFTIGVLCLAYSKEVGVLDILASTILSFTLWMGGCYFVLQTAIELSYINCNYAAYQLSISNNEWSLFEVWAYMVALMLMIQCGLINVNFKQTQLLQCNEQNE